jgi:hypothetical protein
LPKAGGTQEDQQNEDSKKKQGKSIKPDHESETSLILGFCGERNEQMAVK